MTLREIFKIVKKKNVKKVNKSSGVELNDKRSGSFDSKASNYIG